MKRQSLDMQISIGELLNKVPPEGTVIESRDHARFALLPWDEDVVEFLFARHSKHIAEFERIRERMRHGQFHTHEEVLKTFGLDKRKARSKPIRATVSAASKRKRRKSKDERTKGAANRPRTEPGARSCK